MPDPDHATGFTCSCNNGFEEIGPGNCIDIDECTGTNASPCGENQTCVNKLGTFECNCVDGFDQQGSGTSITCSDTNECSQTPCGDNETCNNTIGGYNCECMDGYEEVTNGESVTCEEIPKPPKNPCKPNPCGENATCSVENGNAICACKNGFSDDNGACLDDDECTDINTCGGNQICTNLSGTFTCHCAAGYHNPNSKKNKPSKGGPSTCNDTNECTKKKRGPCGIEQVCQNTPGSFTCSCAPGLVQIEDGDTFRCEASCGDVPTTPVDGAGSWICKEKNKNKKGVVVGSERSCKIKCSNRKKKPKPALSKCRTYGRTAGEWKSKNDLMQC